jgi:peroxiredoxin
MAKLKVGQAAPNVMLQTLTGETVTLDSLWGNGRSALLIFLRHLA